MKAWTNEELNQLGDAEEIEIAPLRRDGTLRKPTTIWIVRVGDDLYIRSVNGRAGAWFRAAQVRRLGRIWAGGVEREVAFMEEDDISLNEQIDAAYRSKYRRYAERIVGSMVNAEARSATLKLLPRDASA